MFTAGSNIIEVEGMLHWGRIPAEFLPTGSDLFYNQGGDTPPALAQPDTPGWNRQFERWATNIIQLARKKLCAHLADGGATGKLDSPDCYSFSMKTKYPLTTSMVEAGWKQWHIAIETKSKEECAELGERFKRYRYAVHCWVSPDGEVVLAKLKLAGKFIPDFSDTVDKLRADIVLVEKACAAILAIPSEKMAEMMEDDEEPDIGHSSSEAFAAYVLRQFKFGHSHYYGMLDDDHAALWDVMQWMAKYGFEEPACLLLQTSDFNGQSAQAIEDTIEEWKRDWAEEAAEEAAYLALTSADVEALNTKRDEAQAKFEAQLLIPHAEWTHEHREVWRKLSRVLEDF